MNDWIARELTDGIARMLTLSLDRTPANDAIDGTINTWYLAVTEGRAWDGQRDAWRFRTAFRRLAREATRWPSPSHFLTMLPAAKPLAQLARPKPSPEVAKAGIAAALDILNDGKPEEPREYRRHAPRPLDEGTKELLRELDRRQAEQLRAKMEQQGEA